MSLLHDGEVFYPIPNLGNLYYISESGRVFSVPRVIETSLGCRTIRGRILKVTYGRSKGKITTSTVCMHHDGIVYRHSIAKLSLLTFVGLPPTNDHVAHYIDGDVTNTHRSNMAWATRSVLQTNYRQGQKV